MVGYFRYCRLQDRGPRPLIDDDPRRPRVHPPVSAQGLPSHPRSRCARGYHACIRHGTPAVSGPVFVSIPLDDLTGPLWAPPSSARSAPALHLMVIGCANLLSAFLLRKSLPLSTAMRSTAAAVGTRALHLPRSSMFPCFTRQIPNGRHFTAWARPFVCARRGFGTVRIGTSLRLKATFLAVCAAA
jgi:hypothetical protein